ncbi:hypothetical protein Tco_0561478 [Tanacetum coccineum]
MFHFTLDLFVSILDEIEMQGIANGGMGEVYHLLGRSIPFVWEKYTICLGEVYHLLGRSIAFAWEKYTTLLGRSIPFAWEKYTTLLGRIIPLQMGHFVWPTIGEENGTTRKKKYEELSVTKKLQADCDLKATNIALQGLLSDVLPLYQSSIKTHGYTQPKRPRNAAWFKENAMLAEAQESGQILDEEQLAFLADPGILDGQTAQTTIPNTAAF